MTLQGAELVLEQLGGRRALKLMLGAEMFVYDKEKSFLSFRFKGSRKFNYLKVVLTSLDLYDLEFGKLQNYKSMNKKMITGLYNDMLIPVFEETTGLSLSVPVVIYV